ncbi:MAG: hypothetical protein JNN15_16450 [Blastocatellia bacterium]|nr:hypothetical protein [Blastocatellia bacterium]
MMKDKEEKQDRKKTEFTENRVSMEFPASTASLVSYYQKQKNRLIYVEPANAFQLDQLVESENGSYLLVPSDRGDFYYVFPAATKFDSPQNFARVSAVYNRVGQASTGEVWIHKPARVVKHQDNLWVLNKKGELSLGRK